TADALGTDLDHRHDVLHRAGEDVGRVLVRQALGDQVHRVVEHALGDRLLAVSHQAVDELADELRAEPGVGLEHLPAGGELAGHERRSPTVLGAVLQGRTVRTLLPSPGRRARPGGMPRASRLTTGWLTGRLTSSSRPWREARPSW